MSIKTELNKTAEYLRRTRKAILGRGGEIAETAGLKDLPDAIFNIPADTSLAFQTDEETAYEKVVPSGAEEYALLKSVGGMSYKCNNLLPYPYIDTTKTISGVTFTDNKDGSITANGTATGQAYFVLFKNTLPVGKYFLSGAAKDGLQTTIIYFANPNYSLYKVDNGSGVAIDVTTEEIFSIAINISSGTVVNNLVFKPMLNEGTTALPYEPYFKGLRHTKVTAFESEGANLFDIYRTDFVSKNAYGFNYTPKAENGILYSGGQRGSHEGAFIPIYLKPNTDYTFSYNCYWNADTETDIVIWLYLVTSIQDSISSTPKKIAEFSAQGQKSFTFNSENYIAFGFVAFSNTRYGIEFSNVQLVRGTTVAPYRPYRTDLVDTYTIPEAVQSLEGYGEGNPDNPEEYNYTDLLNKEQINIGKIKDGSWVKFNSPIKTDISDLLTKDNFIKVEGGGVIRAVNEYKQDAPSEIKYTVKVGS